MLQADHIDGRNIDKIGRSLVIAAMLIADMKADLAAVWITLRPIVQSDHFKTILFTLGMAFMVDLPEIIRQVGGVGGDTAAARRISGDKRNF